MELPPVILWAVPPMLALVAFEFYLQQRKKRKVYENKDLLASIGIGVGNLLATHFTKILIFGIVLFFYNLVPWTIPHTWWAYIACLVCLDFSRYWAHRIAHENRLLWATHVTHHSSKSYNFSTSFRLSWVQHVKIVFFLPVALMGFHPVVFFVCHQVEVLYQFWLHTQAIGKTPRIIEFIFTTPSHHRVHHATNPQYINKNYGSTFIIWDRLFGSFALEEEKPIFGITKELKTYNPVTLVFHEFVDIFNDMRNAGSIRTALFYMLGDPGKVDEHQKKRALEKAAQDVELQKEVNSLVEEYAPRQKVHAEVSR